MYEIKDDYSDELPSDVSERVTELINSGTIRSLSKHNGEMLPLLPKGFHYRVHQGNNLKILL